MKNVCERNGFVIRESEYDDMGKSTLFPFYVYHPSFDGVFIDSFETYKDALGFCDEEDAEVWREDLMNGLV